MSFILIFERQLRKIAKKLRLGLNDLYYLDLDRLSNTISIHNLFDHQEISSLF